MPPNPPISGCSLCADPGHAWNNDCGVGCDWELRASGNTPIARSLYDLRTRFFPDILNTDSKKTCRPYKVIVLTDGEETCGGNPSTEAGNLFHNAAKSIPVYVVGFGSTALKPGLDAIALAGGTTAAVVVDNEVSLALAMANIISESILKEKCNTLDDDCDGACDEDWSEVAVTGATCTNKHAAQTCTAGVGICCEMEISSVTLLRMAPYAMPCRVHPTREARFATTVSTTIATVKWTRDVRRAFLRPRFAMEKTTTAT